MNSQKNFFIYILTESACSLFIWIYSRTFINNNKSVSLYPLLYLVKIDYMQGFSEKMQGPGQLIFLRPLKKKKKKLTNIQWKLSKKSENIDREFQILTNTEAWTV